MTTLTELPASFSAGSTVKYSRSPSDYPAAAGWTLTLYLAGKSTAQVVAAVVAEHFEFTLTAAVTATLEAGAYTWLERASKAGETYDEASGQTSVTPNLADAQPGDLQSTAEKQLAVVEAKLEGRLAADMESYSIKGRAVSRIPFRELQELRAKLQAEVARERNPGGFGTAVHFTFERPR